MTHGGDAAAVERAMGLPGGSLLDLSQSLNPFAPDVAPVVARHAGAARNSPDPAEATAALAAALGAPPAAVLLTAGGAEAIELAARAIGGGRAVEPDFGLYPRDGEALFASDPRNPTGERVDARDAAVVDEAFLPLVTGTWRSPRLDDAIAGRVLLLGSLTKVFACPGLRVGYAVGDVDGLRKIQRPWSVSSVALACVPDLLAHADLSRWASELAMLRQRMVTAAPWPADPGVAPYVTFRVDDAAATRRRLLDEQRVLVRDCTSFGLPDRIRVAVHRGVPWL
jgi:histidinol-phosphate/aromatic aminotransferase/cobyric acid decarboxylase-like protein